VEGFQAEELLGGAVVFRAGGRDGEHHRERGPVGQEVEALGRHQAQCPARPHQRRQRCSVFFSAGGVGDAGGSCDGAVAQLVEGIEPGCERPGQGGLQGGAGLVPVGEHVRWAGGVAAAGGVPGEPGGDDRVGVVVPAVQHDVGDGDAERRERRELPARPARRAAEHAGGVWSWPGPELDQDRGGRGRWSGRAGQG
jgi:hypothetical protein